ncbi:MAG: hypothetical protein HXY40_02980 [Chloroflexi bacterium]|nr:hypothetical protein [Chloroflexota bacterium]
MAPLTDQSIAHLVKYDPELIDRQLPLWARRSNPLVRRQLGVYWKILAPEPATLLYWYMLLVALILISTFFPFIFRLAAGVAVAAVILAPLGLFAYLRILLYVGHDTARGMVDELRENTLALLRITPMNIGEILLSKVAAAIWRRGEELGLIMIGAFGLTLPLVLLQYTALFSLQTQPYEARFIVWVGVTVCLARLILEPLMIGAAGVLIAVLIPYRNLAALWTMILTILYFIFLNLPRVLPLTPEMRLLVEIALPVLLPVFITLFCFRAAAYLLLRD